MKLAEKQTTALTKQAKQLVAAAAADAKHVVFRQRDPRDGRIWYLFEVLPPRAVTDILENAGWTSRIWRKAWSHLKDPSAVFPVPVVVLPAADAPMYTDRELELNKLGVDKKPRNVAHKRKGFKRSMCWKPYDGTIYTPGCIASYRGSPMLIRSALAFTKLGAEKKVVLAGYFVTGIKDGYYACDLPETDFGEVLRKTTPALLAALEYRWGYQRQHCVNALPDDRWRELIAAALASDPLPAPSKPAPISYAIRRAARKRAKRASMRGAE